MTEQYVPALMITGGAMGFMALMLGGNVMLGRKLVVGLIDAWRKRTREWR